MICKHDCDLLDGTNIEQIKLGQFKCCNCRNLTNKCKTCLNFLTETSCINCLKKTVCKHFDKITDTIYPFKVMNSDGIINHNPTKAEKTGFDFYQFFANKCKYFQLDWNTK